MRRGVFHYANASPPVTALALRQFVLRYLRFARQLLLAVIITLALVLPPPTTASATAKTVYTRVQTYAAWSCRGVYHVVRRGETIYSIARKYGTTAYRIAVCNGLASYTVYVGQTLLVPVAR
jgi:LysM repeat protein